MSEIEIETAAVERKSEEKNSMNRKNLNELNKIKRKYRKLEEQIGKQTEKTASEK